MQRLILAAIMLAIAAPADAQLGPPIPADQILRQQNQPAPAPPPQPVSPPPLSAPSARGVAPTPRVDLSRDRASRCQHQATVERVPRAERGAYVHACIND